MKPLLTIAFPLLLCAFAATMHAEQTEFTFQARIDTVETNGNPNFDLPFDTAEGKTIVGTIAIDAGELGDDDGRGVGLVLRFGEFTLSSSNYRFGFVNDLSESLGPILVDQTRVGPIENPSPSLLTAVNTGAPPRRDMGIMYVDETASFPVPQFAPDRISDASSVAWQPVIVLEGPSGILGDPAAPVTPQLLNAFASRRLEIGFENVVAGQFGPNVIVSATIGAFQPIPEPTGLGIAACFLALVLRGTRVRG